MRPFERFSDPSQNTQCCCWGNLAYHTATTEMVNGFTGIKGAWELGGQGHRSDWERRGIGELRNS